jgi:NapC/NirT cytochrome c family, N-terminal region
VNLRDRAARWLEPAIYLANNRLSILGIALTTSSAITLVGSWFLDIVTGAPFHPYSGIIFFLILPAIFVLGLLLIPIGIFHRRWRLGPGGEARVNWPTFDLRRPLMRRVLGWVAGLTAINILLLGIASYRGVEYMDSANFCGQTCHTVMQPEFTAYQNSPHQRVACVACHIGPGADWFARSKVSGLRQVVAVVFHNYDRPIPVPVEQLRPARETCEQCHWPQMFTGDKLVIRTKYSDDEKNTPMTTVLLLKIGGYTGQGTVGIHGRHLDVQSRIQYVATNHRQTIPSVTYVDDSGKAVQFTSSAADVTPESMRTAERRTMDCVDCHNRPSHAFQLPEEAVDQALSEGRISRALPFIKKEAVEFLKAHYADRQAASREIAANLDEFYRKQYPDVVRDRRTDLEQAISQVQAIYARNVFPDMNVTWGTYPNNLGHTDFPGCFRCHDGNHTAADGRVITNDCSACHTLLAVDDPNPKILSDLEP